MNKKISASKLKLVFFFFFLKGSCNHSYLQIAKKQAVDVELEQQQKGTVGHQLLQADVTA